MPVGCKPHWTVSMSRHALAAEEFDRMAPVLPQSIHGALIRHVAGELASNGQQALTEVRGYADSVLRGAPLRTLPSPFR